MKKVAKKVSKKQEKQGKKEQTKEAKVVTAFQVKAEPEATPEKVEKPAKMPKASAADLDALRKPVEEAKAALIAAEVEAQTLEGHAREVRAKAKAAFQEILAPYRKACRRAGVACEFGGTKAPAVAPRIGYIIERVKGGIKIAIKGKPESEETIPEKELKESAGKAAQRYMEKWAGDKAAIGNKVAGVGTRLRAILAEK